MTRTEIALDGSAKHHPMYTYADYLVSNKALVSALLDDNQFADVALKSMRSLLLLGQIRQGAIIAKKEHESEQDFLRRYRKLIEECYRSACVLAPDYTGTVEDLCIDAASHAIPVRLYRPASVAGNPQARVPVLLYFFGGGFSSGSIDAVDNICRYIGEQANIAVLSVGYRLAPEHPYPAALDDAVNALLWIHNEGCGLALDNTAIAVAGDSAGGNLATVLAMKSRDRNLPPITAQALLYPPVVLPHKQTRNFYKEQGLDVCIERVGENYIGERSAWQPYVSPLFAQDLTGMPSTLLISAELDAVTPASLIRAYGDKLSNKGVAVEAVNFMGVDHGFAQYIGMLESAQTALDLVSNYLKAEFNKCL